MIKVEKIETYGWEAAIRGMRNPMNSWDKSDSYKTHIENPQSLNTADFQFFVGEKDLELMKKLCDAGPEHRKFLRQIFVSMDITAPLYWWKEFDTYKVGTTANSCSTMHKIAAKEFELDDFSHEHLDWCKGLDADHTNENPYDILDYYIIGCLNRAREAYLKTKDKKYWWFMIQLLPSSYNQKRTVTMTYENVMTIIRQRTGHKLDEWNTLVDILRKLPYMDELYPKPLTSC